LNTHAYPLNGVHFSLGERVETGTCQVVGGKAASDAFRNEDAICALSSHERRCNAQEQQKFKDREVCSGGVRKEASIDDRARRTI